MIYDRKITLGNLLTIAGGLVTAVSMVVAVTLSYSEIKISLSELTSRMTRIECQLAYAGVMPTTGPCVLPPTVAKGGPRPGPFGVVRD